MAAALVAVLVASTAEATPARKPAFDAAPADAPGPRNKAPSVPHEQKPFVDKLRENLDAAQSLYEALVDKKAKPSALAFAMELLRAKDAPEHVVRRALREAGLEQIVGETDKKLSRAAQLLKALEDGSLLQTLSPSQFDTLAGALRLELRNERAKVADDKKLPSIRQSLGKELAALGALRLPKTLTDEVRALRGIAPGKPVTSEDFVAIANDPKQPIPDLLGLVGRLSLGADSVERTLSPVTAPRRLREARNALASSPRCPGIAPAANERVFSIPGHGGGGGASLDDGGPEVSIVQGPHSTDILLPKGPELLDSSGEAQAEQLKSQAAQTLATANPVFPIELYSGNSVAQCNSAFASGDGRPLRLGIVDEAGQPMCEMPLKTAGHCPNPIPDTIRIPRLGRYGVVTRPRVTISRPGDEAVIGIRMPCDVAEQIPMLPIATPQQVANASMGVLFTNPRRHVDDQHDFLVMKMSGGNEDFFGFNADLVTDSGHRVNDGVGTRVGDSGGPFVIYVNGKPFLAGVNSFGVFPPGQDPHLDPSVYAQQGGIANGGRRRALDLIAATREKADSPALFTAAKASSPPTHKGSKL